MDLSEEKTVSHLMCILELLKSREPGALVRTRNDSKESGCQVISFLVGLMLISGGFRNCSSSTGTSSFQDKSDQSSAALGHSRSQPHLIWGKQWDTVDSQMPFNHRSLYDRKGEENPTCPHM